MNGVRWSRVNHIHDKIIIVGTGPSLEGFDFNQLYGKGFIIAVNDAHKYLNNADIWFTLDPWGLSGKQTPKREFKGEMWAAVPDDYALHDAKIGDHRVAPLPTIKFLKRMPFHTSPNISKYDYLEWGFNEDRRCINSLNSGFGAFNFAFHCRPRKILLLGMDATSGYFFDKEKETRPLDFLPWIFESTKVQLEREGIAVLNGSHLSKIDCFQQMDPQTAIEKWT